MLTYELALVLKPLPKAELCSVLKRTASLIFNKGGVIRKMDNMGAQNLPFKTSKHGQVHRQGHYFVMTFVLPPKKVDLLTVECERDVDLIRSKIYKSIVPSNLECTLIDELKPAPYRAEVQKMIEIAQKKEASKHKFKYNTGLDYYPFQK